jgi:hypothetical protein
MDDPHVELKYARLRHMQRLATSLLIAMVALLALSATFKTSHPWLQWVQAFAAAATVGAIADWFAVVALFHHPLGVPFPHTAIVPANKDRIGASLGHFIEHTSHGGGQSRNSSRNLSLWAADWLLHRPNSEHLAGGRRRNQLLDARRQDVGHVRCTITPQLRSLDLASIALPFFPCSLRETITRNSRPGIERRGRRLTNRASIKAKFSGVALSRAFWTATSSTGSLTACRPLLHEVASNPARDAAPVHSATDRFIHKLDLAAFANGRRSGANCKHWARRAVRRQSGATSALSSSRRAFADSDSARKAS